MDRDDHEKDPILQEIESILGREDRDENANEVSLKQLKELNKLITSKIESREYNSYKYVEKGDTYTKAESDYIQTVIDEYVSFFFNTMVRWGSRKEDKSG